MHTVNIEIGECIIRGVSDHLQDVKNNGKSLTVGPKKLQWSLTGGGNLLEVPTVSL